MGYGDEILAAGQAERLYAKDPSRRVAICDIHKRPRWHDIWIGNPILAHPDDVARGEAVQRLISAPHARPYIHYPFTVDTGWTFDRSFRARDHRARIYLTASERSVGAQVRQDVGPYALIDPWSKHENLRWPLESWRALVASRSDLTWVQHVYAGVPIEAYIPGARQVVTETFRAACGIVSAASVYIRGESGMCHAAAALAIPQVTIWGACMDWDVLGGYQGQIGILNYTPASPCGKWKPCGHCAVAMAGITVDQVSAAVDAALRVPVEA